MPILVMTRDEFATELHAIHSAIRRLQDRITKLENPGSPPLAPKGINDRLDPWTPDETETHTDGDLDTNRTPPQ